MSLETLESFLEIKKRFKPPSILSGHELRIFEEIFVRNITGGMGGLSNGSKAKDI